MKVMARLIERHPGLAGLAASNAISNGTTFAILLLMSAFLAPDQYGSLTIAVSVLMQLSFLLEMGTGVALVRFYNSDQHFGEAYVQAVFVARLLMAGSMALLALPCIYLVEAGYALGIGSDLALLALTSALIMSWWNYLRSLNQARQNFSGYAYSLVGLAVVRWIGVGLVFAMHGNDIMVAQVITILYLAAPLCIILFAGIAGAQQRQMAFWRMDKDLWKRMGRVLEYGRWIFASSLLFPLSLNVPLWWLGMSSNLTAAGSLGIGMYFANAMAPVREAIKVYMLPKVAGFSSAIEADSYVRSILGRLHYALPIALLLSLAAVGLQYLLNGSRYEDAYGVIVIMIATQVITMFTTLIGSVLHYFGQPQFDVLVNVARVLLSVILSAVLVPHYGAVAAALIGTLTTLAGEMLLCARVRFIIRRELAGKSS